MHRHPSRQAACGPKAAPSQPAAMASATPAAGAMACSARSRSCSEPFIRDQSTARASGSKVQSTAEARSGRLRRGRSALVGVPLVVPGPRQPPTVTKCQTNRRSPAPQLKPSAPPAPGADPVPLVAENWSTEAPASGQNRGSCRAVCNGLPTMRWLLRTGLTLQSRCKLEAPLCARIILVGRATSVPFTAVLAGPERTTTDNAKAASTCAVLCLRR
jgi:hypothetical protein